jgi:hypothetical protein
MMNDIFLLRKNMEDGDCEDYGASGDTKKAPSDEGTVEPLAARLRER